MRNSLPRIPIPKKLGLLAAAAQPHDLVRLPVGGASPGAKR